MGKQCQTFFGGGSKITADADCSHEIKRRLLLGRKVMANLDSIFKSRYITLPTKVHLVKAMVFSVVMYGCESWTIKKAEHQRPSTWSHHCCCCQSPSGVQFFVIPWTAAHHVSLFLIISQSLPRFMFIASVMPSSHLTLWHPLLLLPSVFPSIRDFASESSLHIQWPKYWSFSFSISLSSEYSQLIFRQIDCFDLLAVQETLEIFSSTIVQRHQFFGALSSLWSNSHNYTWPMERP